MVQTLGLMGSEESFLNQPVKVVESSHQYDVKIYGRLPDNDNRLRIPADSVFFLASGAIHKLEDWQRILRQAAPNLFLLNGLTALEDSPE